MNALSADKLFVYGTLRFGSKNEHAERLAKEAQHMGIGTVRGRLFRVSHFPALAPPRTQDDFVKGDVFTGVAAELMEWLDEYEGIEYRRELTEVTMKNGRVVKAFVYLYALSTDGLEQIPSGDWTTVNLLSSAPESQNGGVQNPRN